MKYLRIFAVTILCMLLPAIGIVYYKYQTSIKYNKLKPVKLRNGDIVFQTSVLDGLPAGADTISL